MPRPRNVLSQNSLPLEIEKTLQQITPVKLLTIYHLAQKQQEESQIPSPLSNKEILQQRLTIQKTINERNPKELLKIIDEATSQSPFASGDQEYKARIAEFKNYIENRWNAQGEDSQTRINLTRSLCDFFLNSHSLEPGILYAQFPPQKDDFNCFTGICERLDEIRSPQDLLLRELQNSFNKAFSQVHENAIKTVAIGNQVHSYSELKSVFEGEDPLRRSTIFAMHSISAAVLATHLNAFPRAFYNNFTQQLQGLDKSLIRNKIITLALKIIDDKLDKDEKETALLRSLISGSAMEIADEELLKIGNLKTSLEQKLRPVLAAEFQINLGEALLETDALFDFECEETNTDSETNASATSKYTFLPNPKLLGFIVERNTSYQLHRLGDLFRQISLKSKARAGESTEALSSATQEEPISAATIYSKKFQTELIRKLKSSNEKDIVEALNIIYALSKPGNASCIFQVCNKKVSDAAKELKLQQKLDPNSFELHRFKLEQYLKRRKAAKEHFRTTSEISFKTLYNKKLTASDYARINPQHLLFILCNLPTEDALEFVDKLTPAQISQLLSNHGSLSSHLGQGVSNFSYDQLITSLLIRPDFTQIFPRIVSKASDLPAQEKVIRALLLLNRARSNGVTDPSVADTIMTIVQNVDVTQIHPNHDDDGLNLLLNYLTQKDLSGRPIPIKIDDPILYFIQCFGFSRVLGAEERLTVLMLAAINGHVDLAKFLIAADADINAKDSNEITALMFAAIQGHKETVKTICEALREKGDLKNALEDKDKEGINALTWAAINGHKETVKYLISIGADINAKDPAGKTASEFARNKGHEEIAALLQNYRNPSPSVEDPEAARDTLVNTAAVNNSHDLQ